MKLLMITGFLLCAIAAAAQPALDYISEGNTFYTQTQYQLAEAAYRKALRVNAGNTTAQFNLANALYRQKKYSEAAQLLQNLYQNAQDKLLKSAAAYNQGVAYTQQKELEASIEAYKNALRLNPSDQQARENLQKALSELKQKQNEQKQQQQKHASSMSQKEAEQKLKLLQQKENQLQQRLQSQNKQKGGGQRQDW